MSATPSPAGPRGFYILYWLRTLLLLWAVVHVAWLALAAWTMAMRGTLGRSYSGPRLDPPLMSDLSDLALAAMHLVNILHALLPAACLILLALAVTRFWRGRLDLTVHAESGAFSALMGVLIIAFGLMNVTLFLVSRLFDEQVIISFLPAWQWILSARPVLLLAAAAGMAEMWRRGAAARDNASSAAAFGHRDAGLWRIVAIAGGAGLIVFAFCVLAFHAATLYVQLEAASGHAVMGPGQLPAGSSLPRITRLLGPVSLLAGFVGWTSLGAWVIGNRTRLAPIVQQTLAGAASARVLAFLLFIAAPCAVCAAIYHAVASDFDELRSSPGSILLVSGVWGLAMCQGLMYFAGGALLLRFARVSRHALARSQPVEQVGAAA